eukprot:7010350-Prorocentrum_lima.AAC.1
MEAAYGQWHTQESQILISTSCWGCNDDQLGMRSWAGAHLHHWLTWNTVTMSRELWVSLGKRACVS